jgi:hypothetical protein
MEQHSKLSPSMLYRAFACPGSVQETEGCPDTPSAAAEEGTAMHEVAKHILTGRPVTEFRNQETLGFVMNDERISVVEKYVGYIRELQLKFGGQLLVEQTLPIPEINGWGTTDAALVGCDDGTLRVFDLKCGRGVRVYADGEQLRAYALPLMREWDLIHDISRIELHIVQPRLGNYDVHVVTPEELDAFAGSLVDLVERVAQPDAPRIAGASQCRFCPAKGKCPALQDEVRSIIVGDECGFEDLDAATVGSIVLHDNEWFATVINKLDLIRSWCDAVETMAETRMKEGHEIPGYKLVAGRAGNRKWKNEAEVEALLKKWRLSKEEIYAFKVISPTTAQKNFAATPKRWLALEQHIERSEGKPEIAPVTDKRPSILPGADSDFDDLV